MHERGQVGVLTPRTAALALAGARRPGSPEQQVRAAVDAQIRRTGLAPQDADDVRSEVALVLLQMHPDERLACDRLCARAAAIARNKSIDVIRRDRRARPSDPTSLSERAPAEAQSRLLGGLDAVQAEAHLRLVRPHLRSALGELGERDRVVLLAHIAGQAHVASGLPRSTFYRVLSDTREHLRSRLAAAIAAALLAPARLLKGLGASAAVGSAATATVVVLVAVSVPVSTPTPRIELPASESAQAFPGPDTPPVRAATAPATPERTALAADRDAATLPVTGPARASSAAAPTEPAQRAALPAPAPPPAAGGDICPYDRSSYYC